MKKFRSQIINMLVMTLIVISSAVVWNWVDVAKVFGDDFIPSASITNSAPSFTAGPSDGGSSTTTPTTVGNDVTFTATATDVNNDPYYLAICKENSITPGADAAPTCGGAGSWAVSAETASGAAITPITYTTQAGDSGTNDWYAFVCDKKASGASCSSASQGSGDSGSPFYVNAAGTFGTVTVTDTNNGSQINPGDTLRFTLPQAEIDDDGTINMYICTDATTAFNYTSNSCTGGSLICSDTAVDPTSESATCDETGNTLVPTSDTRSTENFKVYVEDNHDLPGTGTNAQTYDIVNTAPTHDDPEMDVHAATLPNSVAYWQFEDGSSATAFDDETSNANNLSCTNCPAWDPDGGISGGAYDFDGDNDRIQTGSLSGDIDFSESYSASLWVNLDDTGDARSNCGDPAILMTSDVSAANFWYIVTGNGTKFTWQQPYSDSGIAGMTSTTNVSTGEWYYVVVTHDKKSRAINMYVNGVNEDTDTYASNKTLSNPASAGVRIGGVTTSCSYAYSDGRIDEPHIYNRALTADEISQIYSAYTGPPEANLVSHWSFNNGPDGYTQALSNNVEGNWDVSHAYAPSVLKDGSTYKMWYSGSDGSNWRILYSTSIDGSTWTTPIQALNYYQEGTWDTSGATGPSVIKDGDIYKMWYSGYDGTNFRILYTTSTDGINWAMPVQALDKNVQGSLDTRHASHPSVIKDGSTYKMWYSASDITYWRILYTTSTDGINWSTPVLAMDRNREGSWDVHAYQPSVIKDGSTYKMWYQGYDNSHIRLLYSTSTDGINWTTPVRALDYSQEGTWDTVHASAPSVIKDGNTYKMWYSGQDTTNYHIIYTKINYMDEFGGNDGVMGGGIAPTLATGYYGKAVDFNGTSDYIDFIAPVGGALSPTDQVSIAAWIKTAAVSEVKAIVDRIETFDGYGLLLTSSGNARIAINGGDSAAVSLIEVDDDEWHHVVGTYNKDAGGTDEIKIYVDGVQQGAGDYSTTIYYATEPRSSIGAREDDRDYFDGLIDEVRIYDAALSATEVQQLYYASKYHDSNQDLSCKALGIDDHDSDTTTTIFNWLKDDTPITVLNMPFDSDVSSVATDAVLDYSGNANHGQLGAGTTDSAPTWTSSGVKGGAYDFDGTDDYVAIDDNSNIDASLNNRTYSAWIKIPADISGGTGTIRSILSKYPTGGGEPRFDLHVNKSTGHAHFTVESSTNADMTDIEGSTDLRDNQWHYVVGVRDRDADEFRIHVDGVIDASPVTDGDQNGSNNGKLYIGDFGNDLGNGRAFDGFVDEVRIYNTALSPEQIAQNYNNGKPNYSTIVNQETAEGDVSWQCEATVNDLQSDNPDSVTNSLGIISPNNSAPVQAIPSSRVHAPLDSNSVGYWRFEDGDITSNILDQTSNNITGSCTNCPTWTSEGAIGGSYEFDGVDDYITLASGSYFEFPSSDFSATAWIKPADLAQNFGILETGNPYNVDGTGWIFYYDSNSDAAKLRMNNGSGMAVTAQSGSSDLSNEWHHVAFTADRDGNAVVYIDGVAGTPENISGKQGSLGTDTVNIGVYNIYFDGLIDEVHVYDRALSATEIANLYNSTSYVYDSHDLGVGGRDISDADDDSLYATVDWRESGTSMAVLNMSFNESVTSTAADAVLDYSSYANHGQLGAGTAANAPTWTNATTCGNDSGGCYDFDASDDFIEIPDHSSFDMDEATIELWIKPDENLNSSTVGDRGILGKYHGTPADGDWLIRFEDDSDSLIYEVNDGGGIGNWERLTATTTSLTANNDYHIAVTTDSTNGSKIYINGVEDADSASVYGNLGGNTKICIGTKTDINGDCETGAGFVFSGYIDEVRIYDRALTVAQIQANYNAGKPNYQGIAYGETSIGESWSANITLTEGNSESSTTIESNDVEILGFSTDVAESWDNSTYGSGTETESSDSIPTHAGEDVVFTGTYNTAGEDWYLAICKTNAVTAGDDAAPTCDSGAWAISSNIADGASSSTATTPAVYTTSESDASSNDWYAFACTKVSGGGICSPSTQGSGNSGSPFVVNHAPVFADNFDVMDTTVIGSEAMTDGDMELAGVTNWATTNSTVTKETGTPHGGSQVLRIAYNGSSYPQVNQNVFTLGNAYKITGWARGDGSAAPSVLTGAAGLRWIGTSSTSWQSFELIGVPESVPIYLRNRTTSSGYVEFDDVSIVEIGSTTEPGEQMLFKFQISDADNETITVVVCDNDGFNDVTRACVTEELCRDTVNFTATATYGSCLETDSDPNDEDTNPVYIGIPQVHDVDGTYANSPTANRYTVHAFDPHYFPDDSTTSTPEEQFIDVEDVAPTLVSYTATDTPVISAGGSDTIDFSAIISDENGEADVESAEGYLFDDTAINLSSGACTPDENDCYYDDTCTFNDPYGTNTQTEVSCQVNMFFNANASSNWEAHVNASDETSTVTDFADSNVDLTVPTLAGINITEPSISYGTLVIGTASTGQSVTLENLGNQTIDVLVSGDLMCTDSPTCAGFTMTRSQQKWTQADGVSFDWDNQGHALLSSASTGDADTNGCANIDMTVRDDHSSTATNENLYWILKIPSVQATGTYTGSNTIQSSASTSCTGTP